jgi:hypothetical protein
MEAANDNRCDYYVYAWLRPCGAPFYVGKGRGKRDRIPKYNNPVFSRIVDKIRLSGDEPTVIRLHENLTEAEAFDLERAEIAKHGRRNNGTGTLANLTDGGEGNSGWSPSEKTKEKIGAAHAGKILSEEHRSRLLEVVSNPSAETRARMSAAQIGRRHSKETLAKMSENNAMNKPEHRARVRAALTGLQRSDETRAKISAAASNRSEEHLAKIGAANRMRPPKSGYKGVSFNKKLGKWKVAIRLVDKRPHLGYFTTPEDAARAYDNAAIAAWGVGNCYLNFPVAANDNQSHSHDQAISA